MTTGPDSSQTRVSAGTPQGNNLLARWAVGLVVAVAVLIVVFGAIFAVAYARGGSAAISDNWVGFLGAIALIGGLVISLVAFVLAVAAKVNHEKWAWLWLPIAVFPALLTFVVFGEMLWWE